jgi:hypothetical protein
MAEDKKVAIEVEVKGSEQSIESMKDLKAAIKAAKDEQLKAASAFGEGSDEFLKASKKVSQLKDRVDDLNDSTKSLKGSGIERASEGFNQLGEGLRNLDFDKVKVGLTAMKTALAAVGIGLIVQAVMYLVENFEELSKGSGILAKSLQWVGGIITSITNSINAFTDSLGLTNTALDAMGEATVENANKSKEALAGQTAEYDRQIAVAKASGKSAIDLEIAKQQAIIETNKQIVKQIEANVRANAEFGDAEKKLLTESLNNIQNAVAQQNVITLTAEKEKNDKLLAAQKEYNAKKKAEDDILKAEADAAWAAWLQSQADEKAAAETAKMKEEQAQLDLEARQAEQDRLMYEGIALRNQESLDRLSKQKEEAAKKDAENEAMWRNNSLNYAQSLNSSLQSLSDSYFYFKTKNLQKGSAEELKQAKKQFDINKALQISQATIQGIQGVMAAYSSGSAIPVVGAVTGPAFAALAGLAAAANISKIASAKFNEGGGGSGAASAVASVPVPAPPTINTPAANTNSSTLFDESGKKIGGEKETKEMPVVQVRSTVSVTEINEKQNDVRVLEAQSTFK